MQKKAEIILVNLEEHSSYCLPNPIKVFFDLAKTLKMNDFSFHYSSTLDIINSSITIRQDKHNIIVDDLDNKILQLNFKEIKAVLENLANESGKNVFIFSQKTASWFDISTMAVKRSIRGAGFEIKEVSLNKVKKAA